MAGNTMYDVVVLSSSPPAASPLHDAPSRRVAMLASSPLAFSPPASPLRPTVGASKSNARAAPIPEGAVRGFATVGSLIRSEHFTSRLDDDFDAIQQAQPRRASQDTIEPPLAAEKPKKRTTKKATATTNAADGSEKPKPKPRARKAKPKSDREILDSDDELGRPPQRPTKSPFFDDDATESPGDPAAPAADAPKLTKSGKPRKPRAKKVKTVEDGTEPAPKPKKPRVTKAKAGAGKGKQGDASLVSAHLGGGADGGQESATRPSVEDHDTQAKPQSIWEVPDSPKPKKKAAPKQRQPDPIAQGLELEEAVVRRRDWTPPPDTTIASPFTDSTGKENKTLSQNANGSFTNLLSNFAYAQSPSAQTAAKSNNATGAVAATKRRRIELVEIPNNNTNSRDSSPEKGKAPKKKPRTITDLVTEQYALKDAQPVPDDATSNFFESRASTTTTKVPLNDASAADGDAAPKKPVRRRNSSKSGTEKADPKPRSKKASSKAAAKPKPNAEKLLSPSSAMSRLQQQDVLFGTSSQLVLEESPTMVRQLQYALKESEQDVDNVAYGAPPRWSRLGRVEGKRGLWAASSRDDEGGMLEHLKDVYIPEPDRTEDIPLLMDGTTDAPDEQGDDQSDFIDIDDIPPDPPPPIAISSDPPMPPPSISRATPMTKLRNDDDHMKDTGFRDIDDFMQEPPPSGQKPVSPDSFVDIDDFDFPPSAQMRKSPVSIFKPPASAPTPMDGSPKKRGRPTKSHSAIPTSVSASSTSILKPRAKSKTSTKMPSTPPTGSGRFIDIDEILDSEDEALQLLSPTPPRTTKHANSQPLSLITLSPTTSPSKSAKAKALAADQSLAPIHRIPTPLLEWPNIKAQVFAQITSHIRSLPPTTDPSKPTWHEKILMYDPIVIEDFTAYLNAHTPIRVYKKATQKQIKAWNADLKKQDKEAVHLGVGPSREGDGSEVFAVEKELESTMVQGWCESLSVCCIWGENRTKKGTARKGFY
ncbi:uncharacterized protein J4E79_005921 [Alternaria viburni]|uniref:uncharacterized protein n=1 Tax=Alternaria viburni TaxID=566460 RepID=UPI0020C59BB7|nr:uncharacterized protein J4E79_005921 [Alternaria viburni]KAI4660117.1 hypothetical protein J4E79_005921 [Alternaria viburni]